MKVSPLLLTREMGNFDLDTGHGELVNTLSLRWTNLCSCTSGRSYSQEAADLHIGTRSLNGEKASNKITLLLADRFENKRVQGAVLRTSNWSPAHQPCESFPKRRWTSPADGDWGWPQYDTITVSASRSLAPNPQQEPEQPGIFITGMYMAAHSHW